MVTTRRRASSVTGSGGGGDSQETSHTGMQNGSESEDKTPTSRRTSSRRPARLQKDEIGELEPVKEAEDEAAADGATSEDDAEEEGVEEVAAEATVSVAADAAEASSDDDEDDGEGEEEEAEQEDGDDEEDDDDEDDVLELMAATMRAHSSSRQSKESTEPLIHGWKSQTLLPPSLTATNDEEAAAQFVPGGSKALYAPPGDLKKAARQAAKNGPKTKGSDWFDLPAQTLDDDTKRELRLIRLRGAYDPKRFYKGFDSTKLPTYFQVGTVVNGPADHFAGRLSKSEARNTTVTQQLLKDDQVHNYRKKRYARMQEESQRWSGPNKRGKKLAGSSGERVKKRKPKPKH